MCGRGRLRSQDVRGALIPPSPHAGGDACAPRTCVVRSFRLRRMRAGTPALPGRAWCAHSAFAARGRGRPRTQDVRGALIPPSLRAGGDARAPRLHVVRSFRLRRMRARTPALPGCTWFGHFAFAACGRGRPCTKVARGALIPPSPHAGGDACAPRTCVVRSFRLRRMRAGTPALPGRAWCAHSAFAARGRGRPRTQDVRGALIPPSLRAGGDARAPRLHVVRSFRLRRMRARTPALPGCTWFGHFAFAACGRGRPCTKVARGSVIPLSPHAGGDARAPRLHVVRSFRLRCVRAGTPVHPGRAWFGHFAFAACGRGRPRSQVARGSVIPPSPHAGGDARAPRTCVVRSFCLRCVRAGTPAHPGRAWCAHSAFAACGRGRPRSQDVRGALILPSLRAGGDARAPRLHVVRSFRLRRMRAGTPALPGGTWFSVPGSWFSVRDARAPSIRFNLCENCYRPARRLVRPRRWSSQIEPSRLRRWRDHADHRVTRTPTVTLSAIAHRPSAIGYQSSAIGYRLSAIGYRLSAIGYRPPPGTAHLLRLRWQPALICWHHR
jgi:hypothetical protein